MTLKNPKKTINLYGFENRLNFLVNLYKDNKLPQVLMISGKKGIGKFTLINHFLNYIFDNNYNLKDRIIDLNSKFNKQYLNEVFQNIIYLSGHNFKSIKIEDIRNLKETILSSSINDNKRFIILDDIEQFNKNSLNALLKIIEEPPSQNYFILINNQSRTLLETIYSRSIEIKIFLTFDERLKIIDSLIQHHNLSELIDYKKFDISPGNFLSFNQICVDNEIDVFGLYSENLLKLLSLFKKNKDINCINLLLLITENYFYDLLKKETKNKEKVYENKSYVVNNINNFIFHNLNQNSLINDINRKLLNE